MTKPKKVLFKSQEEAEAKTGYFKVSSIMVSCSLGEKIRTYISRSGLYTFSQPNQSKTCHNIYTLNFTLKEYHAPKPRVYLVKPGSLGYYTKYSKSARDESRKKYQDLKEKSPTLEQMYFWVVRKYPLDLLWMEYDLEPKRLKLGSLEVVL